MRRREGSRSVVLSSILLGVGWGTALPTRASDVSAPDNVRRLAESSRIDVDLRVFKLVFVSDTLLGVPDSERAAFWDPKLGESPVEFTRSEIGRVS